ncbi:hypothetical protein B6S44_09390 [Bosea sp. Tri-44]|nr:hypothetical protein B6S44_09390 [Bosea sp. Tri-44]
MILSVRVGSRASDLISLFRIAMNWEALSRLPVSRFRVWKRTFSLSEVAGLMATGQVTSEILR